VPWMMIDDQLHGHRKFVKLGRDRLSATGLWLTAGSWVAGAMTDGFIPDYVAQQWDPDEILAKRLVQVGLWHDATVDGEAGYQFHDWAEINRTRDQIIADRAANTRRTALHRDPKLIAAVRGRDQGRCRYCGVQVNWNDRRSGTAATYDHVDPDGGNTLDNVVIACRACHSAKAGRTPEQAGMPLLSPGSTGPDGPRGGGEPAPAEEPARVPDSYLDTELDSNQIGIQIRSDLPSLPVPSVLTTSPAATRPRAAKTPREEAAAKFGDEFEQWYAAYPRREDPQDAAKAWMKVRRSVSHDELMAATHRYARQGLERQYTKLPATWLNKGSYASEPDRPRLAAVPDSRPAAQVYADLWERADATAAAKLLHKPWIDPFRKPSDPDPTPYELWVRTRRREFIAEHRDQICAVLEVRRTG
jgi:hypothetical protein